MWRRKKPPTLDSRCDPAGEARLVDAEERAETLLKRAEFLRAVVLRRDQRNHWQESVNQLFQGGTP